MDELEEWSALEPPFQKNKINFISHWMEQTSINIPVQIFPDFKSLEPADALLLDAAHKTTANAYAPYSNFRVGAAIRLINGQILTGSNQENASYPTGICAERVTLSAASATYPGIAITSLALTYINESGDSNHPISPCGICRQTLAEYEQRFGQAIRLILGGSSGKIYIINRATDLLPFAFSSQELKSH
jgi:cytidine deaminase